MHGAQNTCPHIVDIISLFLKYFKQIGHSNSFVALSTTSKESSTVFAAGASKSFIVCFSLVGLMEDALIEEMLTAEEVELKALLCIWTFSAKKVQFLIL